MNLVIAEKPSVARSIATVIGADEKQNGYWQGGGYLVSWCIGHLVSFAEAGQYDEKYCKWKYEDLPILPQPWQFIVPDEKKQQFEIVRALLNRSDVDSAVSYTHLDVYKRQEYGSARWGTAKDIAPYIDPKFENNILRTQTERLSMTGRPKDLSLIHI